MVAGQFDVEAAEPVPILSGRRHLVIPQTRDRRYNFIKEE